MMAYVTDRAIEPSSHRAIEPPCTYRASTPSSPPSTRVFPSPFRASNAGSCAERCLRIVKSEPLDHLIATAYHLERVLRSHARHCIGHRPRQGLVEWGAGSVRFRGVTRSRRGTAAVRSEPEDRQPSFARHCRDRPGWLDEWVPRTDTLPGQLDPHRARLVSPLVRWVWPGGGYEEIEARQKVAGDGLAAGSTDPRSATPCYSSGTGTVDCFRPCLVGPL